MLFRRLFEVAGVQLVEETLLVERRKLLVQRLEQRGVLLGDRDRVLLAGRDLLDDLAVRIGVGHHVLRDGQILAERVRLSRGERGERRALVVVGHDRRVGKVLGRPVLARGPRVHRDGLTGQVVAARVAGILQHGDRLVRVAVRLGEVDVVEPIFGDGDRGDGDIHLAARVDGRDQGVELLGRKVDELEPHAVADLGHKVVFVALGLLAVHRDEGRVVAVRPNGERTWGDEAQRVVRIGFGRAAGGRLPIGGVGGRVRLALAPAAGERAQNRGGSRRRQADERPAGQRRRRRIVLKTSSHGILDSLATSS